MPVHKHAEGTTASTSRNLSNLDKGANLIFSHMYVSTLFPFNEQHIFDFFFLNNGLISIYVSK